MNIVMMTNTYTPHVGGVAHSVTAFTEAFRDRGHRVLVVAPVFPEMPADEPDVVRIPALQNFNGSDFSVVLPVPGKLDEALDAFNPDIIHAHHPFLIGSTALRVAAERQCPLLFTQHTLYEAYTHYVPGDSPALKRFVIELSTSYGNSCDQVIAPSESIADLLHERGVNAPVAVLPTGIDQQAFGRGNGARFRAEHGIPKTARVIGHVGRLAEEKNLHYLSNAIQAALRAEPTAHCLMLGDGTESAAIDQSFAEAGLSARLHRPGTLGLPSLADAYAAMDVFAFASLTETQGMVLAEAMTAGVPVIALDAPGAREVVKDGFNGRLLTANASPTAFAKALTEWLGWADSSGDKQRNKPPAIVVEAMADTAARYSMDASAERALAMYSRRLAAGTLSAESRDDARAAWQGSLRRVQAEWVVIRGMARAAGKALTGDDPSVIS
ncbi:MAG: glycosyltransferase [Spiribacter sp.]|jgi:glycosyltransferase involved in cell wall biosynthesis|nr:glycosyltransferase [Spiribacter sp.]MDR9489958.1 glycosyltransferase [Spiribacter sp.]